MHDGSHWGFESSTQWFIVNSTWCQLVHDFKTWSWWLTSTQQKTSEGLWALVNVMVNVGCSDHPMHDGATA